ncbi:MAG TPA: hypothetical protein DGQ94_20275 [Pseudomonas sp.]|nr:hypothetical protein [Pseudomonas sp.]
MSENSLPLLLAWMKDRPEHGDWDFIAAMAPAHLDRLLLAAHVQQVAANGGVVGIDATIPVPNGPTHNLYGYRLGAAELALSRPSYEIAQLEQRTPVSGGVDILSGTPLEGILALSAHDLLDPLWLSQTLPVAGSDGQLSIDLADAHHVQLSLGRSAPEREAGAEFFKAFQQDLPPEHRIQNLVEFVDDTGNAYLRPRSLGLRTHQSKADGSLAVVFFGALQHGPLEGGYPTADSAFPFLLTPEQGLENPLTLLLTRRLLHRAAFAVAVEQMLDGGQFRYDEAAQLRTGMRATAGHLVSQGARLDTRDFSFQSDQFSMPAASGSGGLRVELLADRAELSWLGSCTLAFRYKAHGEQYWQPQLEVTFDFHLQQRFDLFKPEPDEADDAVLLGQVVWPLAESPEVTSVTGLPRNLPEATLGQMRQFFALTLKQAVLERLAQRLTARIPEQVQAAVRWSRHSQFAAGEAQMPHGVALFGQLQGIAALRITEPHVLLAPGDEHQFEVDPAYTQPVSWRVALAPGSKGSPGTIDPGTGRYRAPPRNAMPADGVRVLVIAQGSGGAVQATALATVLRQRITVNPLIRVCYFEDQVDFTAGSLGGAALNWSVANPGPGSGSLTPAPDGAGQRYTAGQKVAGVPFVIDEVQVRDPSSDADPSSAHILVLQEVPMLSVSYETLPNGNLQFSAHLQNGPGLPDVQWVLQLGPGELRNAVYVPDPASAAHFLLVTAAYELPGIATFHGHLILPLIEGLPRTASMPGADSPAQPAERG